jgi:hypothetical protein
MAHFSETDACLALDESLSDASLTRTQRQNLIEQVVLACLVSHQAKRRLEQYGKVFGHSSSMVTRTRSDKSQPLPQVLLTSSQQRAWDALEETAALYFSGALKDAMVRPRTARLIAGPSGVGKTHLLRSFAKAKGYGFLSLTYGQWVPNGARSDETTVRALARFLSLHERCVIAIDELDKFHGGLRQEWSVSVQNDLFGLLDRTLFDGHGAEYKKAITEKLRDDTFLVGCGTWQSLWSVDGGAKPAIGFSASAEAPMSQQIRAAREIPTELLNRFHPDILLLEPLRASEIAGICEAAGLTQLAEALGASLDFAEAERSGLGMRWVEAQTLNIHLRKAKGSAANFA